VNLSGLKGPRNIIVGMNPKLIRQERQRLTRAVPALRAHGGAPLRLSYVGSKREGQHSQRKSKQRTKTEIEGSHFCCFLPKLSFCGGDITGRGRDEFH
jgi:hypothetical protein